jgi:hypothetical protein
MFVKDLIGSHVAHMLVPSVAAADATELHPIFIAPIKCVVLGVQIVPQAAVTGDNTDTKNLNILNAGADGSGSTEVANLDLVTGTDLVANDAEDIPLNTTYDDGVELAEGDVLALQVEKVGNGVLLPDLLVEVKFRGNGV